MVSQPNRLFQCTTSMSLINKICVFWTQSRVNLHEDTVYQTTVEEENYFLVRRYNWLRQAVGHKAKGNTKFA